MSAKLTFYIRGDLITLDALLKAQGITDSGAQAKQMIAQGQVRVDGEVELRKTRKLRGGEIVLVNNMEITLARQPQ